MARFNGTARVTSYGLGAALCAVLSLTACSDDAEDPVQDAGSDPSADSSSDTAPDADASSDLGSDPDAVADADNPDVTADSGGDDVGPTDTGDDTPVEPDGGARTMTEFRVQIPQRPHAGATRSGNRMGHGEGRLPCWYGYTQPSQKGSA